MIKKITIIGGAGFIGTNLSKALTLKNQDFEIIDLKLSNQFPEKCKIGDVRDIESLRKTITGDVVVNLAAVHRDDISDKSKYHITNVKGNENIAIVCSEKGIRKIIFTSSVAVYGYSETEIDESGIINPFSEYGRSKFNAEEKLRQWNKDDGNLLSIIRPTVVFGEGNRGNVFNLFNQIATGKFIMIGNGENKKSIAYIGNVVAFIEMCISSNQKYSLFNYVDTPNLTMNELISEVRSKLKGRNGVGIRLPYWFGMLVGKIIDFISIITGKKLPISSIRIKKFISSTQFTSLKAETKAFNAPFLLTEGIHRTLQSEFVSPDSERETFYTE